MTSLSNEEQMNLWQRPCQFCGRLTGEETCAGCQRHREEFGHLPTAVRWQQVPGQPRVVARFCGACGRELSLP